MYKVQDISHQVWILWGGASNVVYKVDEKYRSKKKVDEK